MPIILMFGSVIMAVECSVKHCGCVEDTLEMDAIAISARLFRCAPLFSCNSPCWVSGYVLEL
jgi:hypothetical protein